MHRPVYMSLFFVDMYIIIIKYLSVLILRRDGIVETTNMEPQMNRKHKI